jgi:hypothetical protein
MSVVWPFSEYVQGFFDAHAAIAAFEKHRADTAAFEKRLGANPYDIDALKHLAALYVIGKCYAKLPELVDRLAAETAVSDDDRYSLARQIGLRHSPLSDEAIAAMHAIAPRHLPYIHRVADVLAKNAMQVPLSADILRDAAGKLAIMALELPGDAAIVRSMGQVQTTLADLTQQPEDYRDAAATLENLDPKDKDTYDQLGDIYLKLGVQEKDFKAFDKAEAAFRAVVKIAFETTAMRWAYTSLLEVPVERLFDVNIGRAIAAGNMEKLTALEAELIAEIKQSPVDKSLMAKAGILFTQWGGATKDGAKVALGARLQELNDRMSDEARAIKFAETLVVWQGVVPNGSWKATKLDIAEAILLKHRPGPVVNMAAAELYLAWMIYNSDMRKGELAETRLGLLERQMPRAVVEIGPDVTITVKAMRQRLADGLAKIETERAARVAAFYAKENSADEDDAPMVPPIPYGGYGLIETAKQRKLREAREKKLPPEPPKPPATPARRPSERPEGSGPKRQYKRLW